MQEVLDFLAKEHVAAVTVEISDGELHGAALHFSHVSEPEVLLYFSTDKTSRKASKLHNGPVKAAVVIGLDEKEWVTIQLSGQIRVAEGEEVSKAKEVHYSKHPNSRKFADDPNTIMLVFKPTFWRFTNFNTDPITILNG